MKAIGFHFHAHFFKITLDIICYSNLNFRKNEILDFV